MGISTTAIAQEHSSIGDLPQALICAKGDVTVVGYLAKVNADGSAIYVTPNDIYVEVSPDGKVGSRSSGTCSNKTIDELRANGQTRNFAK